jgi:pimeloyl-ACP methyl ester carboxylesterase
MTLIGGLRFLKSIQKIDLQIDEKWKKMKFCCNIPLAFFTLLLIKIQILISSDMLFFPLKKVGRLSPYFIGRLFHMKLSTKFIFGFSLIFQFVLFMITTGYTINYLIKSYTQQGLPSVDFIVPFWLAFLGSLTSILSLMDFSFSIFTTFSSVYFYLFLIASFTFWIFNIFISFICFVSFVSLGYSNGPIALLWVLVGIGCSVSKIFLLMASLVNQKKEMYEPINEFEQPTKRTQFTWISKIGIIISHAFICIFFLFYILLVGEFTFYSMVTSLEQTLLYKPHGDLIEINAYTSPSYAMNQSFGYSHYHESWKMHIYCTGKIPNEKTPTILLSHGGGSSYITFFSMQSFLSNFTQVCSFDRSGYGYSQVGPFPRTVDQEVAELHQLLQKKGINNKILFVGHSAGGNEGQFFAFKYPSKVAGLNRMDSPHEFYYMYEDLHIRGISKEESFKSLLSRVPLLDIIRHASVFGLTRLFVNGRGFEDSTIGSQHASLYGTKNWNSQFWSFSNSIITDTMLNHSRWENTPQSNGVPGQMFGGINLHLVKASNHQFNKTCEEMGMDPKSESCEIQERKRKDEVWQLEDYKMRSSNSKIIICEYCDHGLITNDFLYSSQLVLNQLKEIQNEI